MRSTLLDLPVNFSNKINMSDLDTAVLERRIKALEEEARLNKNFRDYAFKRFAEWQGKTHESATSHARTQNPGARTETYTDDKSKA
jgi:hypothetical protein